MSTKFNNKIKRIYYVCVLDNLIKEISKEDINFLHHSLQQRFETRFTSERWDDYRYIALDYMDSLRRDIVERLSNGLIQNDRTCKAVSLELIQLTFPKYKEKYNQYRDSTYVVVDRDNIPADTYFMYHYLTAFCVDGTLNNTLAVQHAKTTAEAFTKYVKFCKSIQKELNYYCDKEPPFSYNLLEMEDLIKQDYFLTQLDEHWKVIREYVLPCITLTDGYNPISAVLTMQGGHPKISRNFTEALAKAKAMVEYKKSQDGDESATDLASYVMYAYLIFILDNIKNMSFSEPSKISQFDFYEKYFKADSLEVRQLKQALKKSEKSIESYKERLIHQNTLQAQIRHARNDNKLLEKKLQDTSDKVHKAKQCIHDNEALRQQISQLQEQISELKKENKELKKQLTSVIETPSVTISENQMLPVDDIVSVIKDNNICIVGGRASIISKLRYTFPNWSYIDTDKCSSVSIGRVRNNDLVVVMGDSVAHAVKNAFIPSAKAAGIQCITTFTNNFEMLVNEIFACL